MNTPIFYQLFDKESSTYTYIIAGEKRREALIIDPVREHIDRDLRLINELDLDLKYIFDTHIHADHITASGLLRKKTGAKIVLGNGALFAHPDIALHDGDQIELDDTIVIVGISTPGHTMGCMTYFINNSLFTGDALLIRKTGRSDFQGGSSEDLYDSIQRLYQFPDDTRIYPGHDYDGHTHSTIGEEKKHNSRIKGSTKKEDFLSMMSLLCLPPPYRIKEAVPANIALGLTTS